MTSAHRFLTAMSVGLNAGPSEYGGAAYTAPTVTASVEFIFFFFFVFSLVDKDQREPRPEALAAA